MEINIDYKKGLATKFMYNKVFKTILRRTT